MEQKSMSAQLFQKVDTHLTCFIFSVKLIKTTLIELLCNRVGACTRTHENKIVDLFSGHLQRWLFFIFCHV